MRRWLVLHGWLLWLHEYVGRKGDFLTGLGAFLMLVGCFVHVLACGANTYSAAGAGGCTGCPANSQSGAGASTCVCNAGYGTSGSGSSLSCPGTPYDFGIEPDAAHADERERMTSFRFLSACPAGQTSVAGGACTSKLAILARMSLVGAALSPFKPARCFHIFVQIAPLARSPRRLD